MIKKALRTFFRSSDVLFLVELSAFVIAASGAFLLLAIAIFPVVSKMRKTEPGSNQKESVRSFAQWAAKMFAKMTTVRVAWSVMAYALFRVLDVEEHKSRFFIVAGNLITLIYDFLDSVGRILTNKPDEGAVLTQLLNKWRSEGLLAPPHLKTAWSQRGGVQVGTSNLRSLRVCWPFGGLSATAESIKISYLFGQIILRRADLERIEHIQGLFESEGLRFKHLCHDIPPLVVFWPMNARNLALKLAQLGFEDYLAPGK